MGRRPCYSKEEGLTKGAWTAQEDTILTRYINTHGEGKWRALPKRSGLKRCGKSCRLRWLNYLRPNIKRGNISCEEEDLIIRLHNLLGNRWSLIAGRLPGRTDNEIKNYWNTNLGKKHQKNSTKNRQGSANGQGSVLKEEAKPNPVVVRTKASRCIGITATTSPVAPEAPTIDPMTESTAHHDKTASSNAPPALSVLPTFMDVDIGDLCIGTEFLQSCEKLVLDNSEDEFGSISLCFQNNFSPDCRDWMENTFHEGHSSQESDSLAAFLYSEE
ncbi:hypothetical protein AMTRI_Chr04g180310 [Amborella trichopoda]|uniref:Uncharacterized protein n=1 Tax=Amborella trichopoda TaxID=13333 RepID=W1PTS7_AMBTC|nr:transcription factor WER [Amborella trichopoda]ERN11224.1 hypothetical protein AMTR_s00024p00224850 [Amborella trichopoda]|eukprot:XP_006849643.1 transcription factor WER [Amborella trichopoda]